MKTKLSPRKLSAGLPASGTYFESMTVENVRCFSEAQTLSLVGVDGAPVRWTIVLGENGVGKTTLLQALALGSRVVDHERVMFESWDHDDGPRPEMPFSRGEKSRGKLLARLRSRGGVHETTTELDRGQPSVAILSDGFVCGYGAGRRLGASRFGRHRRQSSAQHVASLFADAPLRNAEEWLLGEDYAAAKEGDSGGPASRRLERLKELLVKLLPDVRDVRVGGIHRGWGPSVDFATPYGWVPLEGLSLGYQSLVAWMVDLAAAMFARYARLADPLAGSAIVLVDEIDLHLHPKWQRDLMRFLTERFPNTQFIATAHSPLVVQAADDANVVLLKREGDHVVIENHPTDVRNWRVDQILTSDLYGLPTARPPSLDALIAERRKILTKPKVTAKDTKRLDLLERQIGELPSGESPEQMRAMRLIMEAANSLSTRAAKRKA